MHIDTDEGNAANIRTGMLGYIEEIQTATGPPLPKLHRAGAGPAVRGRLDPIASIPGHPDP